MLHSLAILAAVSVHAYASEQTLDIDTHFRAKIAKEKVKQDFQKRRAEELSNGTNPSSASTCGSQNIGNVDTGGQIGSSPREVFVFAPNAINLVTPNGCH
jgi:hypothetical protein